jgi:hypothetical protein
MSITLPDLSQVEGRPAPDALAEMPLAFLVVLPPSWSTLLASPALCCGLPARTTALMAKPLALVVEIFLSASTVAAAP